MGDNVCLTKKQDVFHKGYLPCWTEELFTVSALQFTDPITYNISDINGEQIKGTFFEQEMQTSTQDTSRIDKMVKTKGNKLLVKWLGYSHDFNSWVDKEDVLSVGTIKRTSINSSTS